MSDEPDDTEGTYLSVRKYLSALAGPDPDPNSMLSQALRMAADVAKIANEYDVRRMTPGEIAQMSRRLYLLGVLTLPEYAALSLQPDLYPEFYAETPSYRAMRNDPDRPRDYLSAWQEHLAFLQTHHPEPENLALAGEIVDLLASFEPAKEDSDPRGE